jgi:hypothetical protein
MAGLKYFYLIRKFGVLGSYVISEVNLLERFEVALREDFWE